MQAYLINPHARIILTIEIANPDSLAEIYDHLRCGCITAVNLAHGDAILLDDEGLFRSGQAFFAFGDYSSPLAGYGLVVGSDDEGATIAPRITLEKLQQAVRWLSPLEAQLMHNQTQAAAAKAARELMCDNRHASVYVMSPIHFIEED